MKFLPVVVFSLCLVTAVQSASACNAISNDVAQLGSLLNSVSNCTPDAGLTLAQIESPSACLGDVVVCAAEAAVSGDHAQKAAALRAITQGEAYLGLDNADTPPQILSAIKGIKTALLQ